MEYSRKCNLEELDLRDSKVTSQQFVTFLDVLKSNKTLKYLNLGYNNLVAQSSTAQMFNKLNFGNTLAPIAEEGGGATLSAGA